MSPSPLHPRSTATSTLFASTLVASFVIVAIPHMFPCPRPHTQRFDSNGQLVQNSKQRQQPSDPTARATQTNSTHDRSRLEEEAALFRQLQDEAEGLAIQRRECPVPKPRGIFGKLLGFDNSGRTEETLDGQRHARTAEANTTTMTSKS